MVKPAPGTTPGASLKERKRQRWPSNSRGIQLHPEPLLAAAEHRIDFGVLEHLAGESILDAAQFSLEQVVELARFSALLERTDVQAAKPLDGRIAITAFFEASTRTRLSFESALHRLDAKILSVPDGKVTSVAKGESLADIGEMMNTYGDVVIMRHPETASLNEIDSTLQIPLINAGNGTGEHPTQALADWYALLKWRPDLVRADLPESEQLRIGVIGTPSSMRAVRSFLRMTALFGHAVRDVTIISEMADPIGASDPVLGSLDIKVSHSIDELLPELDVLYMNSIAFVGGSYQLLDASFRLTAESPLKEGAVVLHPLARREELDESLDDTRHNLYFAQAAGAVFVRQALLISVLDRIGQLPDSLLYLAG